MMKKNSLLQNEGIKLIYSKYEFDPDFPVRFDHKEAWTAGPDIVSSLHYHDFLEIGYCYKGSGLLFVDNKIFPFSQGDVTIIFKNELHMEKSNPEDLSRWRFVKFDPLVLLKKYVPFQFQQLLMCLDHTHNFINVIKSDDDSGLALIVHEIVSEMCHQAHMYRDIVKALIICLLSKLSRIMQDSGASVKTPSYDGMIRLSPAINLIYRDYNRKISIPQLASLCHMSVTHFRRTFTKVMGVSPYEYLNQIKVHMAAALLRNTEESIINISELSGFSSLSSFSRYFKNIAGVSPKDWRKNPFNLPMKWHLLK